MARLTFRKLAALKSGQWATDGGARGAGVLAARRLTGGTVLFYFRYTTPDGTRAALPLGEWDASGGPELSLENARDKAAELSGRYRRGERDLHTILEAEAREAERKRAEAAAAEAAEQARKAATLGKLLEAYCDSLDRAQKQSARGTRSALYRHVRDPWPQYWIKPAAEVDLDELVEIVGRLVEAGTIREAAKLRSYLRAAYSAAVAARQKPDGLPALRELGLKANPARELATIDGGSGRPRTRALSVAELRAYWKQIQAMPDPFGALLRFHLLTGGQRLEQLARLTVDDWDKDAGMIRLLDGKGRRSQPRAHYVPLLPEAEAALLAMAPTRGAAAEDDDSAPGPYLFTVTNGVTGAVYTTVRDHLREAAKKMAAAGKLTGGPFTPGDLRRTVETRLAGLGFSREVRAQLQSHGLGGIQGRHYDAHDYADEKREALAALYRLLTEKKATVTPFRRKA